MIRPPLNPLSKFCDLLHNSKAQVGLQILVATAHYISCDKLHFENFINFSTFFYRYIFT